MKRVSIVIPNYNNAMFIKKCLESVACQKYANKEIIVVDDGSTDNSLEIIKDFIKNNDKIDIKLFRQNNLNAAIARNLGMEKADGDYVLFLDSDDILNNNSLKRLVDVCEKSDADLVIGGYEEIDEMDVVYGDKSFTNKDVTLAVRNNFMKLMDIKPAPSNKLYNLDIIRKNNLTWGNVRIGQDLNFYLKYLSLCKKVSLINLMIYKYRATPNSMTRSFDFRIFDIVNVFDDVKKYYIKNGKVSLYNRYLPLCALRHYESEMSKQFYYNSRETRFLIVKYFSICEKRLVYPNKKMNGEYKKIRLKFKLKTIFRLILISGFYRRYKLNKKRRNVR